MGVGKFWLMCTGSCLWLAHTGLNRGWEEKKNKTESTYLCQKRTTELSCKTNYSPGKLCSKELIILKSKGPISWLTFIKELKLH